MTFLADLSVADVVSSGSSVTLTPSQQAAIESACKRIAPTWPLDQFIAVNPYWGFVEQPMAVAAAHLGQLSGTSLLMPRSDYLAQWQAGAFERKQEMGSGLKYKPPSVLFCDRVSPCPAPCVSNSPVPFTTSHPVATGGSLFLTTMQTGNVSWGSPRVRIVVAPIEPQPWGRR